MQSFEEIFAEYRPRVARYLARLAGEEEAADLTQQVFLKVSRGLSDLREERALTTWIYRIATNVARDHAAALAVRPWGAADEEGVPESPEDLPDEKALQTEVEYIRREMNDCIRGMIEGLPGDYRAVLLLGEYDGFSDAEIAAILDVTLETVKIRLHRARRALRKTMESGCSFYRGTDGLMCDRKPERPPRGRG